MLSNIGIANTNDYNINIDSAQSDGYNTAFDGMNIDCQRFHFGNSSDLNNSCTDDQSQDSCNNQNVHFDQSDNDSNAAFNDMNIECQRVHFGNNSDLNNSCLHGTSHESCPDSDTLHCTFQKVKVSYENNECFQDNNKTVADAGAVEIDFDGNFDDDLDTVAGADVDDDDDDEDDR